MKLSKISIDNFRNLDKVEIYFDHDINFLIGENDLGKSNFLDLLDIIFNGIRFSEIDFFDKGKPIQIDFSLLLNDLEIGVFEDYFDPHDNAIINIIGKQETPDENLKYYHKESEEEIHHSKLRCVNFIKYDSLRIPKEELSFYKGRGVGKFLIYLVNKFLSKDSTDDDFIKKDSINQLVEKINDIFEKLRLIKDYMISASIEKELADLVFRMLTLQDSKGIEMQKAGHGVQFSVLIILYILERLMKIAEDSRRKECIFTSKDSKQISLILGMDEPEIHLHPYMQRSLINFVNGILQNKEDLFSSLIKELFDLDSIDGQAIIVSHSPSILLNNFKHIIRFHRETSTIKVVSGIELKFTSEIEKHLFKIFQEIKESFFSRCVILVEGDTEFGALPMWAEKTIGNLDRLGIAFINAGGKKSIPPISKLLNDFKIANASIIDKDKFEENDSETTYATISNLFITDKKDFEEDLVESIFISGQIKILFDLVAEYDPKGLERKIQKAQLKNIISKYRINIICPDKDFKFSEIETLDNQDDLKKAIFLSWLNSNKSIILGRFIGEKILPQYIPCQYKDIIEQAKVLSQNYE